MTRDVRSAGRRMGGALSGPMNAGLGSARRSIKGLSAGIGGLIKQAGTLGGALSVGYLVKQTTDLNSRYLQLANRIELASGKSADFEAIQGKIQQASRDTTVSQQKLLDAAEGVFASTGNEEYTLGILERIGQASVATGADVTALGQAGQLAFRKFGVTAQEFNDRVLPGLVEKLAGGGLSVEDLQGKFALLATEAESLGFKGGEGFVQLLGLAKSLDNELGESLVPGLKRIGEVMKQGTSQTRRMQSQLKSKGIKIDFDGKSGLDAIREVLKAGEEGVAAMQSSIMSPEARRTMDELVKPFEQAFENAREAGKTPAEASKAGLEAFDRSLFRFGKTAETADSLLERFNESVEKDPGRKFDKALNNLTEAFQQPEMIDAINTLAEALPKLAKVLGKGVSFAAENPALAAGAVVGGRVGLSFAGGALGNAASTIGGKAAAKLKGAAGSIGKKIASKVGASAAWNTAGSSLASAAAGSSKWAAAGKGLGAAAAASIGVALAAQQADQLSRETEGLGVVGLEKGMATKAFVDPVQKVIEGAGFGKGEFDAGKIWEGITSFGAVDPFQVVDEYQNEKARERRSNATEDGEALARRMRELREEQAGAKETTKQNTGALDRLTNALKNLKMPGASGKGSRGPNAPGTPATGSAPREG